MPYCSNCRTYIPDGIDTCPKCGTKDARYANIPLPTQSSMQSQQNMFKSRKSFLQILKNILRIKDVTYDFDKNDISSNLSNAVLAYLGLLVIIPFITSRKSKFAMFHCCQGLMNSMFGMFYVTIVPIILNLLPSVVIFFLFIPYCLFLIVFPISFVLGIVHAIKGKAITLPVFGRIDIMRILFKNL